jgi:alpha-ketoglutarate-dependent taurine dioxygenase
MAFQMIQTAARFAGVVVHAVEAPATNATTNQTVTCFHTIFHATAKINEADSNRSADRRWLNTAYAVFLRIRKMVSVADPSTPNSLLQAQLEMEARVGIGRIYRHCSSNMPDFIGGTR